MDKRLLKPLCWSIIVGCRASNTMVPVSHGRKYFLDPRKRLPSLLNIMSVKYVTQIERNVIITIAFTLGISGFLFE